MYLIVIVCVAFMNESDVYIDVWPLTQELFSTVSKLDKKNNLERYFLKK